MSDIQLNDPQPFYRRWGLPVEPLRRRPLDRGVEIAPVERFVRTMDPSDVLLRHRPLSILRHSPRIEALDRD
jgi:hypothetical protein